MPFPRPRNALLLFLTAHPLRINSDGTSSKKPSKITLCFLNIYHNTPRSVLRLSNCVSAPLLDCELLDGKGHVNSSLHPHLTQRWHSVDV